MVRKYRLKSAGPPAGANTNIDYERELNPAQREVALAGDGPMLVIAGAGSGKTHTLTYRVAHLIERGVGQEKILLLTFTNKAARAMTDRVSALLGGVMKVWGGTFHSVANRVLREDGHLLGYTREFTILDGEDSVTLMRACAAEVGLLEEKYMPKPKLLVHIKSMCVNTQQSLEDVLEGDYPYFLEQMEAIRQILKHYQARKLEMSLMDFDDLLLNWRRVFVEFPECLEKWSRRFEHVLVDEYQDTNHLQGEIVDMLARVHGNVMVVGDDCQSIYAFRGADYRNILGFPQRYPGCRQYKLETNYRSTPEILEVANRSILMNQNQFHKTLLASRPTGPKPALVAVEDVYRQAEFVCQRILDLVDEGMALSEIAVLYRSHHHSMELQVEMTRRNIPYVVRSGMRFFEQAHIKDVLAYLKLLYNPRDELSFMRVLQHVFGVGPKRSKRMWDRACGSEDPIEALVSGAVDGVLPERYLAGWRQTKGLLGRLRAMQAAHSPGAMIEEVLDGGYREVVQRSFENAQNRLADLDQMADYAARYEDLETFLGEVTLLTTLTGQDIVVGEEKQAEELVCLTSIHQAKGLEWSACFVLWLADGYFPHYRAQESEAELEEERRLFYVASTRARDDLYLCHPYMAYSRDGGERRFLRASRFVEELEVAGQPEREPWERWMLEVE